MTTPPPNAWTPRLSFSSLGCPSASWSQVADLATAHHLAGVELRSLDGTVLTPANLSTSLPNPPAIRAALDARGLSVAMLGASGRLFSMTDKDFDELVAFATLADALGCPRIRLFDGGEADRLPSAAELDHAERSIARWQSLRGSLGLKADLAIETHWGLVPLAAARAFHARLPDVALLWDSHHTWRGGESISDYYAQLAPAIVHVHAKDSITVPADGKPFTYCAPGTGEFPWAELGTALAAHHYHGFVSLEWERQWHPSLAPLADVLPAFCQQIEAWPA